MRVSDLAVVEDDWFSGKEGDVARRIIYRLVMEGKGSRHSDVGFYSKE